MGARGFMDRKEWDLVDKTSWGPGPWQGEPDRVEWSDEATGIACLVVRNEVGALCGYVGVPEGHPWYGKHFSGVDAGPDVHRELSYSNECQGNPDRETVCHVAGDGEPETLWWLGFHCSYARDLSPAIFALPIKSAALSRLRTHQTYVPLAYVQAQCAVLAHSALLALEAKHDAASPV
jgi:hypothetical protein